MHILATTANNADISMAIMYEACMYKNQQNTHSSLQHLVTVIPVPVKAYKNNLQPVTLSRTN